MPMTDDADRNVLTRSFGIGWSHHTLMLQLAPRNSQALKSAEHVGTRPFRGAPRRTSRGLSHFRSGVTTARKVWDVPEPIVTRGPPLHTCACLPGLAGLGKAAQALLPSHADRW